MNGSDGAAAAAGGIHALVVDDDPLIVRVVRKFLASRGYAVDAAEDGAAALVRVQAGGINLVILDRRMPGLDGLALCRAIRALDTGSYIYCIMLTAADEEASLVAAMEAGVDDFLGKPVRLPELGARLQAAERVLSLENRLASRNRELAGAYDRLRHDLELARVLHQGQLPPPQELAGVRFAWMLEASNVVGGDVFDYLGLDDRHLCFWQADISGHGAAAAMLAFHVQHQLRSLARQVPPERLRGEGAGAAVADALAGELNRRLLQMGETSLYLTLLLGVVDRAAGRLWLVQAGHPQPLLAPAAGAPFRPVGEGGVPVGILPEPQWDVMELPFPPGARLAVYSDGITDCRGSDGAGFGEERLRQVLDAASGQPLEAATGAVRAALQAWRGGAALEDDVTLLALEAC